MPIRETGKSVCKSRRSDYFFGGCLHNCSQFAKYLRGKFHENFSDITLKTQRKGYKDN